MKVIDKKVYSFHTSSPINCLLVMLQAFRCKKNTQLTSPTHVKMNLVSSLQPSDMSFLFLFISASSNNFFISLLLPSIYFSNFISLVLFIFIINLSLNWIISLVFSIFFTIVTAILHRLYIRTHGFLNFNPKSVLRLTSSIDRI